MNSKIKFQLSSMMFLEFFIWGGWFVTMGTFLSQSFNASGSELAQAYETQSIGAIIAPFIIGLIADRYFSAQKILGFLHLSGALLLYLAGSSANFVSFYPFILLYMILYMPTLALVNSVAFRQMKDPSKEFPPIRVFGTVGWIIAGLIIGYLGWESKELLENTFYVTALASLILGLFSFSLPNTPPKADKGDYSISKILGLDALSLLKDKKIFNIFYFININLYSFGFLLPTCQSIFK
jgi:nucleoside transporter